MLGRPSHQPAPPSAVEDLVIWRSSDDVVLQWSAVTEDVFGFPVAGVTYNVYGGDQAENVLLPENLLATTTDPTYVVAGAVLSADLKFYQVVAERP